MIEGLSEEQDLLGRVNVAELCLASWCGRLLSAPCTEVAPDGEGLRRIAIMLRLRVACSGVKWLSSSLCGESCTARREWVELRGSVSVLRLGC